MTTTAAKNAIGELLETASPSDWSLWLSEIQASLVASGHCEALTREGSKEFAGQFIALQRFFHDLHRSKNDKS